MPRWLYLTLCSVTFIVLMHFGLVPAAKWFVYGYWAPFMESLPIFWTWAFLAFLLVGGIWAVIHERRLRKQGFTAHDDFA